MVFAFNLLYTTICSFCFSRFYNINKYKYISYILFLLPIWSIWLIICGGQYKVGTDYESYYHIFKNVDTHLYIQNREFLFVWITELSAFLNLPPQTPFYIFYFIGFFLFLLIISKLEHKTSFIFIILYLAVSNVFNNQLNGLRQYTAIYIYTLAFFYLYKNNGIIKYIICILTASLIHASSIILLPLAAFKLKHNYNIKTLKSIFLLSIVFSLFGNFDWLLSVFDFLIPTHYRHYIEGTFNTSHSFTTLITKLMYIPLYWYSFKLIKQRKLQNFDLYLYNIGMISYSLRLFFLNNYILNRVGDSLTLISIFPLYYLLRDLYLRKENGIFSVIILFFLSFYLLKVVVFPKQEYLYNSIYFL